MKIIHILRVFSTESYFSFYFAIKFVNPTNKDTLIHIFTLNLLTFCFGSTQRYNTKMGGVSIEYEYTGFATLPSPLHPLTSPMSPNYHLLNS